MYQVSKFQYQLHEDLNARGCYLHNSLPKNWHGIKFYEFLCVSYVVQQRLHDYVEDLSKLCFGIKNRLGSG